MVRCTSRACPLKHVHIESLGPAGSPLSCKGHHFPSTSSTHTLLVTCLSILQQTHTHLECLHHWHAVCCLTLCRWRQATMKGRAMHAEHNAYQPLHTHHQPADSTAANTTTCPGQTKAYRYPRNLGLRYFMGMTFRHVAGEGNAGTFGAWRKIK